MKMYRVVSGFAWKKQNVVVFISAKSCMHQQIWLMTYWYVEERWGTMAGYHWKQCTTEYKEKAAAEEVCKWLENEWEIKQSTIK